MSHEGTGIDIEEKKRAWADMVRRVEKVVDGQGERVEEGIKEAVVVLNLLGVNTTQSCEGHEDYGEGPYIDVEIKEARGLERRLENLTSGSEEEKQLLREITIKNLKEREKLIPYLEAFNGGRNIPYLVRLGINRLGLGRSRIESQGADFQKIEEDADKRRAQLHLFQEEMRAFIEFLKDVYFGRR